MASSHVVLLNSPHVLRLLFTSVVMIVLGIDLHYCSHVMLLTFVIHSHECVVPLARYQREVFDRSSRSSKAHET